MARRLREALALFFGTMKGEIDMLDMYVALVIAGRRTCNPENTKVAQVQSRWRELVLAELEALGMDADGNPVV